MSYRNIPPKKRRQLPCFGILFLPLVAVCIMGLALGVFLLLSVPARAADLFGPPMPHLPASQRFILSARLLWQAGSLIHPTQPGGAATIFRVELGESPMAVSQRLQQAGLISNAGSFRDYLVYTGLDITLQAGEYSLTPAMTPIEIARALQDATPAEVTFVVLAGWRSEEIAASLPTSGLGITPEEFLDAARSRPTGYSFSIDLSETASAEGFLLPGVYELPRNLTAVELVAVLLGRFEAEVSPELRAAFARRGLTVPQAVTLASIVEREAIVDDEMPQIASVFLNRWAIGMKLDSDPTVQYALGYNTIQQSWWTNPLSAADLQIDSPYNTYRYPGLPPGPIANPSLAALEAVAYLAETPYFYFRAACDHSGRHTFAQTFEQHQANACP
jgi:UPF0755 protein